jgi:hypothetical protein
LVLGYELLTDVKAQADSLVIQARLRVPQFAKHVEQLLQVLSADSDSSILN